MAKSKTPSKSKSSPGKTTVLQIADLLELLPLCIEAGCAIPMAFDECERHLASPLRDEVRSSLNLLRLGASFEVFICDLANRLASPHFHRAAAVMRLCQSVGASPCATLREISREARQAGRAVRVRVEPLVPHEE